MPLLSIVTAVFNRADFVGQAIESAAAQLPTTEDVEHIVIDGASTDGTLEVLRDFPHIRLVSEPDSGVYEAMNKGIRLARGEFVGLLNSDDRYAPHALAHVVKAIGDDVDMIGGEATIVDATRPERPVLKRYENSVPPLRLIDLTRGVPRTNAWFIRRSVFEDVGLFDDNFTVAADREWLLRAWQAKIRAVALPVPVYEYGHHEGSLTISGNSGKILRRENLEICRRFLDQEDAPDELQREVRTWQAQLRAGGLRDAYRSHGLVGALRSAIRPSWRDVPWLARAAVHRWRGRL